jgi:hypothetical protein
LEYVDYTSQPELQICYPLTLLRKEMTEHPELIADLGLNPTDRNHIAAAAA